MKFDVVRFPLGKFVAVLALLFARPFDSVHGAPGASVPWTTYEAESMTTTGTILGPGYAPNTVQAEASGRKCVQLSSTGQYVQFAAPVAANSLVVRYSVPNSGDGVGTDYSISLYVNGSFVQKLAVTSKYSWLYGNYPFSNTPQSSPRNFYDEVRLLGIVINVGDIVRLQKDNDDSASYYIIDLVDLENVGPALAKPAGNWLTITNSPYNAVGNGVTDATTALQNCINDARNQGKGVWIPPGNYVISADINNLQNITIQGAGMWYSTFVGNPAVYATSSRRVRFNGGGGNLHFADFAILGKLTFRDDGEANDAFSGIFGAGSSISRVWVEHTKTGAWVANGTGMVIDSCRFRNLIADGVNLAVGMQNSTVTNCTARGTGDDSFAMWPATYMSQTYTPGGNVITHCTAGQTFLANGGALYGGNSNRIEDCVFQDMPYGCGVLISGTFPVGGNTFSGTTVVQRCNLLRCGGYDPGYQWRAALQFTMENNPIANVNLNNLNIIDSASDGLSIIANYTLSGAIASSIYIPNYGVATSSRHALWAQSGTSGSLTISNSTVIENRDDSGTFSFVFVNVASSTLPQVPTGLTATNSSTNAIVLSWNTALGGIGYNVKRSTVSNGPYTVIATNSPNATYTDTAATPGTTYYYVVASTNSVAGSGNSLEAHAQIIATEPPPLTLTIAAGAMQFNWPASHLGWRLQGQTNAADFGISSAWSTVPGSTATNQISIPLDPNNGSAFFRLSSP